MTALPWPDTREKAEKTCSAFVNSPFHVPTPGDATLGSCITTSNKDSLANSHPLYPRGGDWLSQRAHLPCCFYYYSHLSLPPATHPSSPDSQHTGCLDTVFTVKGRRHTCCLLHSRVHMDGWGLHWCAGRVHDPGLWRCRSSFPSNVAEWTLTLHYWLFKAQ